MIYHRHNDVVTAGSARNPAIDEIKWITVKDKNGNELEVMYANGPTCTVQPRLEEYSDYKNIALAVVNMVIGKDTSNEKEFDVFMHEV